jgi:hypothetical protein
MAQMMMDAEVEQRCGAGYREMPRAAHQLTQRLPAARVAHPSRNHDCCEIMRGRHA